MHFLLDEHTQLSLEAKMRKLYDFMHHELCLFLIPEINIAYKYFKLGQKFTFFGKVQKNNNDIVKCVKNMAWDLFHLRFLELECLYPTSKQADFFIPFMFTYDKQLFEVKRSYELNALAISKRTSQKFSFYLTNEMNSKDQKDYFCPEAVAERKSRLSFVNIDKLIEKYENQVILHTGTKAYHKKMP